MALIPHAQLDDLVRNAVAMDLDDLTRRAQHVQREAQEKAHQILAQAQVERAAILKGAQELGQAKGHAEGLEQGLVEGRELGHAEVLAQLGPQLETLIAAWSESLASFESSRETLLSEARTDVLRLALAIAQRVTHRSVQIDDQVASAQLENMLSLITQPTRLRISIHPEDEAIVRDALPALLKQFDHVEHAQVLTDDTLLRGSVVTRSETGGVLDASIKTQLDRLIEEVMPGFTQEHTP